MNILSTPHGSRPISNSLIFLILLAIARSSFCFSMPYIIGGSRVLASDLDPGLASIPFIVLGYYFYKAKKMPRFGLIVMAPGMMLISGISSYRLQVDIFHFGRDFPLIDNLLAKTDAFLGFDWKWYFFLIVERPDIHQLIATAYQSIWIQPFIIGMILILINKIDHFTKFQTALPISFAATCILAAFMPALGAYQYHGMNPDQHVGTILEFSDGMTAPITWLRQPILPNTLPSFPDWRIITFPSWHAAAAVIFMIAAWPNLYLRTSFVFLNAMMLAATPVQGSHYFSDIIVGCAVGVLSFLLAGVIVKIEFKSLAVMFKLRARPNHQ